MRRLSMVSIPGATEWISSTARRFRVIAKSQTVGTGTATLGYGYDLAARIVSITYPSGRIVDYVRDGKGRVAAVTTRANAGAAPTTT